MAYGNRVFDSAWSDIFNITAGKALCLKVTAHFFRNYHRL